MQWYLLPDNGRTVSAEACSKDIKTAMASKTRKIGRDAGTGRFKPVDEARKDRDGSVVETIKYGKDK